MEQNNDLNKMIEQMAQMLNLLQGKSEMGIDESKITPAIREQLAKIEQDIAEFARLGRKVDQLNKAAQQELFKIIGTDAFKNKEVASDVAIKTDELHEKAALILNTAFPVQSQAEEDASSQQPEPEPDAPSEGSDQSPVDDETFRKRRRRKLKRMGGNSDWKPL